MIGEAEVDSGEGKSLAGMLGVREEHLPTIRIFKIERFMYPKYRLNQEDETQEFTKEKVLKLYDQWKQKKLNNY